MDCAAALTARTVPVAGAMKATAIQSVARGTSPTTGAADSTPTIGPAIMPVRGSGRQLCGNEIRTTDVSSGSLPAYANNG
jgi:hypothetical protein